MLKVMYLPLDERPCNYLYPQKIIADCRDVVLLCPPSEIMGHKKEPADTEKLWSWINENAAGCSFIIISIDLVMYGGIVASRLHSFSYEECRKRFDKLKEIKKLNPSIKIYAFNLIMRVPSYNSSEEEPDYYAQYGQHIFNYSYTLDKSFHNKNTDIETRNEIENLKKLIPYVILQDYTSRREVNHYVNKQAIELVKENIVDFLVIPLDDCSEFGFSAYEQRELIQVIAKYNLQDRIYMYPGADEVGCTLTCRVINAVRNAAPKVFVQYSSTNGEAVIPKYEDRPLGESIKYQIISAGGMRVQTPEEADFILMVNSPTVGGLKMGESPEADERKDRSYFNKRNLMEFVLSLKYYLQKGKKCAVADVAFANGADNELMQIMNKQGILPEITAYAGWNTSGNTLGTVISHAMAQCSEIYTGRNQFYFERLIEDWAYMSSIRQFIAQKIGNSGKVSDYEKNPDKVSELTVKLLNNFLNENLPYYKNQYYVAKVTFPWKRLFEIDLEVKSWKSGEER